MRNMERKIKKIRTEEEDKVKAEECLWRNLRNNRYKKQKQREEKGGKKKRGIRRRK